LIQTRTFITAAGRNQLQELRTQLQNAGNRIQRDIAQYTELSQQTMQLTAIIPDGVKKLPDRSYR
jgi:hypothetical protein